MSQSLLEIYRNTLKSVDAYGLVTNELQGRNILSPIDVIAIGKAAPSMAEAALDVLGDRLSRGFVLTKHGHISGEASIKFKDKFLTFEAAHPVPDLAGQDATQKLLSWLEADSTSDRDLLVFISGGASSLLVAPNPPLDIGDLKTLNSALLALGMPIEEMNVLRKHISQVKGGQMATRAAHRYRSQSQYVMVDICAPNLPPKEVLSLVGSGPWTADTSTLEEARKLLLELKPRLSDQLFTRAGEALFETPKLDLLQSIELGSYKTLLKAAEELIGNRLIDPPSWDQTVTGDICRIAERFSSQAIGYQQRGLTGILVAAGEPTVQLSPNPGRGGRCQELALHMARALSHTSGIEFLAGSSDGTDGPTQDSGARVTSDTWGKLCHSYGESEVIKALKGNDSGTLLAGLEDTLITTGPTGQNLNDIFLLQIDKPQ